MDALVGRVVYLCRPMRGDIDCRDVHWGGTQGESTAFCFNHIHHRHVFVNDWAALFFKGDYSGLQRDHYL